MHKRRAKRKPRLYAEDKAQLRMTQFQPKRVSYSQNWQAYDNAQCNELASFMKLLADLCKTIHQPEYQFGRPKLPLSDMVFASALKVYSTFSLRRFLSHMQKAVADGYVDTFCSYSSVSNYMRKSEMTSILEELVKLSSLPLASIESTFAIDSSGFSTSRFARYFSYKHGKDMTHKDWIKAHIVCGTKTNIVAAVLLTESNRSDTVQFGHLMEQVAQGFTIKEILADKAYSSRSNHNIAKIYGATPFIPFKINATEKSLGSYTWKKMWHYFQLHREDFMQHYHKRSNVETVFHMIKGKFRDNLRSKDKTAQFNEILLKILCHNICVVIQEMHELGIYADFERLQTLR